MSPASCVLGQIVTVTATATGVPSPRFDFVAVNPTGSQDHPCGSFVAGSTCIFVPDVAGDWQFTVIARSAMTPQSEVMTDARPYLVADAVVAIDTTIDAGAINPYVLGANLEYTGANTQSARDAITGIPILRFPGGDNTSGFLWTDDDAGTCTEHQLTWPVAAGMASTVGASLFLESNMVRGSPASVAAWITDATGRGLQVPWVDVGNEVWGDWDAGYRMPDDYASDVRAVAAAVQSLAHPPGVVLEIGTATTYDDWNREALTQTSDVINAVDYHYYPNHLAAPDLQSVAAGADGIAPLLAHIRSMIRDVAPNDANHIQIILGEWDGAQDGASVPPVPSGQSFAVWSMADALFYGAAIGEMFEGGVAAAMFYEVQGYRYGVIGGNACIAANLMIQRPKGMVAQLWRQHVGANLVQVTTQAMPTFVSMGSTGPDGLVGTAPVVRSYASLTGDGKSLRLMVVNRSASTPIAVQYVLNGFSPTSTANAWVVAGDSIAATNENVGGPINAVQIVASTVAIAGASFTYTAPAHSFSVLELARAP